MDSAIVQVMLANTETEHLDIYMMERNDSVWFAWEQQYLR